MADNSHLGNIGDLIAEQRRKRLQQSSEEIYSPDSLEPQTTMDLPDERSHGETDKNLNDGTDDSHLENMPDYEFINSGYDSSATPMFPNGFLVINDVFLTNVPTAAISIEAPTDVFIGETLRSPAPVIESEGRQDFILRLSLIFPPGEAQAKKLRRIMSQITKHPFVYIYNNDIKQKLNVPEDETTIFVLEAGSLRSTRETVGVIVLDLQLHYFCYKPFSKKFKYNAYLPGYKRDSVYFDNMMSQATREQDSLDPYQRYWEAGSNKLNTSTSINIADFGGYESSEHGMNKIAEQISKQARNTISSASGLNVPVNLPSESDAWMYYADHLEQQSDPITGVPSDHVGIAFRHFMHINPPKEYSESPSQLSDLVNNAYPEINAMYQPEQWVNQIPKKTVQRPQATGAPGGASFDNTGLFNNSDQLATFQFGRKKMQIDDETALWLGRMLYGEASGQVKKSVFHLWCYVNRWFQWYQGRDSFQMLVRKHSQPINERWIPGGDLWEKWKAKEDKWRAEGKQRKTWHCTEHKASRRLKIRAMSWKQIPKATRQLIQQFRQGQIPYPPEFEALGGRIPTDFASGGTADSAVKAASKGKGWTGKVFEFGRESFFENLKTKPGRVQITPPKDSTPLEDSAILLYAPEGPPINPPVKSPMSKTPTYPPEVDQNSPDYAKKQTQSILPPPPPPDYVKRHASRAKWIWAIQEANGVKYYTGDKKLRNVFYRDEEIHVCSDPELQRSGDALPNIVCSSISITFGHRIAPMRLLSQSHYTYQFLGAGNKTGQIALVFAGPSGRESARKIKEIIWNARDNARDFGSVIKEAGSIELFADFFGHSEQNTILALAGIKNVIIVNVEESNSPDSADKHQLILDFIAQDFAEEQYEKKFSTTLGMKKVIIKSIMKHLTSEAAVNAGDVDKYQGQIKIIPKSTKVRYNMSDVGGDYVRTAGTPEWIARLFIEAAHYCNQAEEEMPPIVWKLAPEATKTWKDKYAEWGAGHLFEGNEKNIDSDETNFYRQNTWTYQKHESAVTAYVTKHNVSYDEALAALNKESHKALKGHFNKNGGPKTNTIHFHVHDSWLNKMEILVRVVREHMQDEAVMKEYFPELLDSAQLAITSDLSSCYLDINLPTVPGESVAPLPPEFYVYDDSHEDPLISNMTDDLNMEMFLEKHLQSEVASIQHYIEKCFLGGSYLSKNLPRILQNRASHHKQLEGERSFSTYWNYFVNGTAQWEPLYTRSDKQSPEMANITDWHKRIAKNHGNGDKQEQLFDYLDSVVSLSPYIREGRPWKADLSPNENKALVNSVYGDAERQLRFGANTEFSRIDATLMGVIEDPQKEALAEAEQTKAALEKAMQTQKPVQLPNGQFATQDGTITVGDPVAEKQAAQPGLLEQGLDVLGGLLPKFDEDFGIKDVAIGAASTYAAIVTGTAIPVIASTLYAGSKFLYRQYQKVKDIIVDVNSAYSEHFLAQIAEDQSNKKLAQATSKIALTKKRNDLSMRRAYPTFKIYFIEDDSGETELIEGTVLRAFDDFYSYSAIQEIKVTRSRKVASDMATIRMTNVGGLLLRRRFGETDIGESNRKKAGSEHAEKQGIFADTEKEHPFEKMILQDGVKVQIRLGYAANPDYLETVFLGQIVEVSVAEDGKILEIMCQGYGAELEAVELGPLENGKIFLSTQEVLSAAIIQDSIANFGRQDRYVLDNPAQLRHSWTGGRGTSILTGLDPTTALQRWSELGLERMFNRYTFLNFPQDDNIFAPPPEQYATSWDKWWNNACIYRPLKQTAWEIFQEHELRHPGYISLAVPYGHSPRMTMFFGSKMQHYWSRPPTDLETMLARQSKNEIIKLRKQGFNLLKPGTFQQFLKLAEKSPQLASAMMNDVMTVNTRYDTGFALGELFGRYIPFRNYHYFDSSHHILKNEIRTSVDGTFNEVEIYYTEDESDIKEDDIENITEHFQKLSAGGAGILAVKLDENISESAIRSFKAEFPSCVTEDMAKRYVQGIFAKTLRDSYKGELIVIGDEKLKPYDICYINDMSINMTGPIEVESVTHIFNRDHGFISIITPDLCLEVNDYYTVSTFDLAASAMGLTYLEAAVGTLGGPVGTGAVAALKGLSFLGLLAGVKFMTWSQDGAPVIATPLTLGGKPFMSNTLGQNRTSLFTCLFGKWEQYWDDLSSAWRRFDVSEAIFDARINLNKSLYGLFGADATGGLKEAE